MATSNILPNIAEGNVQQAKTGQTNLGLPPVGNGAGSTNPGPTALGALPGASSPASNVGLPATAMTGASTTSSASIAGVPALAVAPTPLTTTAPSVTTAPGAVPTPNTSPTSNNPTPTSLQGSLTNQYGPGVGTAIGSEYTNLGSNDSSYMQAYEQSLAAPTAENLATLNTTLGNEGVGANSSTAAIENADYMSNVTSQEGLQEQQLLQTQSGEQVGLLESLEGVANKANSGSVTSDIGNVFSGIAGMF